MLHNATPNLVTYNASPEAFAVGMSADYTAERGGGSTADYWDGYMAAAGLATRAALEAETAPTQFTIPYLAMDGAENAPANFAHVDPYL